MDTYFNRKVSVYSTIKDDAATIMSLRDFLSLGASHKQLIEAIRAAGTKEERRALKMQLPAATIAGTFYPQRKNNMLAEPSYLMCLDIDQGDNPGITDWNSFKKGICRLSRNICYGSLSVSGKGVFLICPIKFPEYYKQQYQKAAMDFREKGIVVDAQCCNVSRLRILSFDPEPYVDLDALPFGGCYVAPKPQPSISRQWAATDGTETVARVMACCREIERRHIDLTSCYDEWLHIGMALASLGESGREPFHMCSRQYPNYNYSETDRKFTGLLRSCSGAVTIRTFFALCRDFGVTGNSS